MAKQKKAKATKAKKSEKAAEKVPMFRVLLGCNTRTGARFEPGETHPVSAIAAPESLEAFIEMGAVEMVKDEE